MKKGNTMQQFLQKALEILRKDFSELRSAGVEQLMYIKEDLIIPHHHSFYDFIVTKARGKSGESLLDHPGMPSGRNHANGPAALNLKGGKVPDWFPTLLQNL